MVGSAGPHFVKRTSIMGKLICGGTGSSNAPIRHFQLCLTTPDLQSGNWFASLKSLCVTDWQAAPGNVFCFLNHNREIKGAGSAYGGWPSARTSRPMPFQKRTNTSWRSKRPQPAVSRRLFRCLGAHLLRSPCYVNTKFVSPVLVAPSSGGGQTPPVRLLCSSSPNSVCRQKTSPGCRFVPVHRLFIFRLLPLTLSVIHGK
jgi:hypothetical protein